MRATLVPALLIVTACGPLTPIKQDGGSAGGGGLSLVGGGFVAAGGQGGGVIAGGSAGGATAGGSIAGGSTAGGSTAGGSTAGGSTSGGSTAGGAAGGGVGPWVWSNLVAQPPPSSTTYAITVASRPGEVYVGMDNSRLYRSTGGAFAEITGLTISGIADLYLSPSGKVYAVSSYRLAAHCLATDCTVAANYVTLPSGAGPGTESFEGICGLGERVFAIGVRDTNNVGLLYEFDGVGAWTKVSNNLGVNYVRQCQVLPSGEVLVVGDQGVVRYDQGATTPEPIDLGGQPQATWNALAIAIQGGTVTDAFVAGGGSGSRYARRNNVAGSWTSLMPIAGGATLYAIAALSPTEFLAAGTGTPRFSMWNGTTFVAATPAPPNTIGTVRDIAVTSSREVFLVGSDGSSSYTIIRGRR